jgi:hypothetical protein
MEADTMPSTYQLAVLSTQEYHIAIVKAYYITLGPGLPCRAAYERQQTQPQIFCLWKFSFWTLPLKVLEHWCSLIYG